MYCVTKYPLSLTEDFHGLSSTHSFRTFSKTNMKNEGSGNVTGLKFKNRTLTQSRTRSPI